MSSTNKTTYYELSQYVGSDKPTYLGDYNADMLKIDTGLHAAADSADTALTTANAANSAATSASTTASTALSTAQTASDTASQAQTTAETALTNAGAAQSAAEEAETAARANVITNLAPNYDPSLTYNVGDLVTYIDAQGSGKMYKCIVAVTTPEAFNINKWDDVTTSEVFNKTSKIISTHTGDANETWRQALNALVTGLTFDPEKEYLIRIKRTSNGSPVSGIYHIDSIERTNLTASASEVTNAILYVTSIYCDATSSGYSTYSIASVSTNGYTYTSRTGDNLPGDRTFELIEINTL